MLLKRYGSLLIVCFSVLFLFLCIFRGYSSRTGFTHLIWFGDAWNEKRLDLVDPQTTRIRTGCGGYDGQFFAQMALDPSLRSPTFAEFLDKPEYRGHKIFLPFLAHVLGMGKPVWILQIYALLNVFFWGWMFWLLLKYSKPDSVFGWSCLLIGILFSTGSLESIRRALTDLPAAAMGLAMAMYIARGKNRWAGGMYAAAIFTKETMLISGIAGLYPIKFFKKNYYGKAICFLIPILMLAGWFAYLRHIFPAGATTASGNSQFGIPIWTMLETGWKVTFQASIENRFDYYFVFPAIIALTSQSVYLLKKWDSANPVWLYGAPFAVLFFFLGEAIWIEPRAAFRILLPMTVAFHLILLKSSSRHKWNWFVLGNLHFPYALINILTYRT